jgi:hypothetical protein
VLEVKQEEELEYLFQIFSESNKTEMDRVIEEAILRVIDPSTMRISVETKIQNYFRSLEVLVQLQQRVKKSVLEVDNGKELAHLFIIFSESNETEIERVIEEAMVRVMRKVLRDTVQQEFYYLKDNGIIATWPVNREWDVDKHWILDVVEAILPAKFLKLEDISVMNDWKKFFFWTLLHHKTSDKGIDLWVQEKCMQYLTNLKEDLGPYREQVLRVTRHIIRDNQVEIPIKVRFVYDVAETILRYHQEGIRQMMENFNENSVSNRLENMILDVINLVKDKNYLERLEPSINRSNRSERILKEYENKLGHTIYKQVRTYCMRNNLENDVNYIMDMLLKDIMDSNSDQTRKEKVKWFLDPAYEDDRDQYMEGFTEPRKLGNSIFLRVQSYFELKGYDISQAGKITGMILDAIEQETDEDKKNNLRGLFLNSDKENERNAKIDEAKQVFENFQREHAANNSDSNIDAEGSNDQKDDAEGSNDQKDDAEGSNDQEFGEIVYKQVESYLIKEGFDTHLLKDITYEIINDIDLKENNDDKEKLRQYFLNPEMQADRDNYIQRVKDWYEETQVTHIVEPIPTTNPGGKGASRKAKLEEKVISAVTRFFEKMGQTTISTLPHEMISMIMIMKDKHKKLRTLFEDASQSRQKEIYLERVWDFVNDVNELHRFEALKDEAGAKHQLGIIIWKQVESYVFQHRYNKGLILKYVGMLLTFIYEKPETDEEREQYRQLFLDPVNARDRDKLIEQAKEAWEITVREKPDQITYSEQHPEEYVSVFHKDYYRDDDVDYKDHDVGNSIEDGDFFHKYKLMKRQLSEKPRKDWTDVGNIERFYDKLKSLEPTNWVIEYKDIETEFKNTLKSLSNQKKFKNTLRTESNQEEFRRDAKESRELKRQTYKAFTIAFRKILNSALGGLKNHMIDVVSDLNKTNFSRVQSQWPELISMSWNLWHQCVELFREMVRRVMADDTQDSEDFFKGRAEDGSAGQMQPMKRMDNFQVVLTHIFPHRTEGHHNHTVRYLETRPKGDDLHNQTGKRSKYFRPYNNLNKANLLNSEIYLDGFVVSNGWRSQILKEFARMKNAWMQTFVQTLKEQADPMKLRKDVISNSLFQFKLDLAVVQKFVADMKKTDEEKNQERREARKNGEEIPRYFVLPEGCLRITTGRFEDTELKTQFDDFLKKFYPQYVESKKWHQGESMNRARQLFTARYRAAFFEAVHILTEIPDDKIDFEKFRKDTENAGLLATWQNENLSESEIRQKMRDKLRQDKLKNSWAVIPKTVSPPKIMIYGSQIANPYLVSENTNAFLVRE